MLLKLGSLRPRGDRPTAEMTEIGVSWMPTTARASTPQKWRVLDITAIEKLMSTSRDPEALQEVWTGWHALLRHAAALLAIRRSL